MDLMNLPAWADDILRCPATGERLQRSGDRLLGRGGAQVATVEHGVIRLQIRSGDQGIEFYRSVGGAHFHERAAVPFAMSSLDTPLYHARIDDVLPADRDAVIVDVGGGDGRNAGHCLSRGCRRVIVVDAVAEALMRFRQRVAEQNPQWLDRLLLIEADARTLPLQSSCAACVIAIETLYYLNEDYEIGLKECVRIMSPAAKLLIAERDYEGGLVLRLLYHGLAGMLELADKRSIWDGPDNAMVRTRCFTQPELIDLCRANGLTPLQIGGTPLLALLLGYLNGRKLLDERDSKRLPDVTKLLTALGHEGAMRRCHIVVAQRARD